MQVHTRVLGRLSAAISGVLLVALGCGEEVVRPFGGESSGAGGFLGTMQVIKGGGGAGGIVAGGASGGATATGGVSAAGGVSGTGGAVGSGGAAPGSAATTATSEKCRKFMQEYDVELPKARECKADDNVCGTLVPTKLGGCGSECKTYVNKAGKLEDLQREWSKEACTAPVCPVSVCANPASSSCVLLTGNCTDSALPL